MNNTLSPLNINGVIYTPIYRNNRYLEPNYYNIPPSPQIPPWYYRPQTPYNTREPLSRYQDNSYTSDYGFSNNRHYTNQNYDYSRNNAPISENNTDTNLDNTITSENNVNYTSTNEPLNNEIPMNVINNRRVNFSNRNNSGTLEILSYGNNPNVYNNLDNITESILNTINQTSTGPDTLTFTDIRNNTELLVFKSDMEEKKCEICHEDFAENDIIRKINNCSHSFHNKCIDAWLDGNVSCPKCRRHVIPASTTDS